MKWVSSSILSFYFMAGHENVNKVDYIRNVIILIQHLASWLLPDLSFLHIFLYLFPIGLKFKKLEAIIWCSIMYPATSPASAKICGIFFSFFRNKFVGATLMICLEPTSFNWFRRQWSSEFISWMSRFSLMHKTDLMADNYRASLFGAELISQNENFVFFKELLGQAWVEWEISICCKLKWLIIHHCAFSLLS